VIVDQISKWSSVKAFEDQDQYAHEDKKQVLENLAIFQVRIQSYSDP
jgi:hypothetical protein